MDLAICINQTIFKQWEQGKYVRLTEVVDIHDVRIPTLENAVGLLYGAEESADTCYSAMVVFWGGSLTNRHFNNAPGFLEDCIQSSEIHILHIHPREGLLRRVLCSDLRRDLCPLNHLTCRESQCQNQLEYPCAQKLVQSEPEEDKIVAGTWWLEERRNELPINVTRHDMNWQIYKGTDTSDLS